MKINDTKFDPIKIKVKFNPTDALIKIIHLKSLGDIMLLFKFCMKIHVKFINNFLLL